MEEAAEDAEAAVESAQQHSSEDIVNVSLLLPSPVETQCLVHDKVLINSSLSAAQTSCVLISSRATHD